VITGTVIRVNTADNTLELQREGAAEGQDARITLSWKDDLPGLQALENAEVGSRVSVEVDDTPFGGWQVTSAMLQHGSPAAGQQRSSAQPNTAAPGALPKQGS
jgi:hypothetical protein